ncbi:hypothetical protein BH20CHL5_BH20CHL5_06630 [soil metagenome]
MSLPGAGAVPTLSEIGRTLAEDLARLDEEAAEIELLVQQIRAETERHEARRLKGEERVTTLEHQPPPTPGELDAARVQLLTLTRWLAASSLPCSSSSWVRP